MDADLKWLVGIAISVCVFFTGSLIGSFRSLSTRISQSNDKIHLRIDGVKENYVRRDDLDGHINRIEENIKALRKEQQDNHQKLLEAILSIKQ